MDPADLVENWDEMSSDERLDALGEAVNDMLERYGYDPVDVVAGDVNGAGLYDDETGTVFIDQEHTLEGESGLRALETAYHEGGHAMEDQDDGLADVEHPDDYNETTFDWGDTDADGEFRPTMVNAEHAEIRDFAVAEALAAAITGGPSPQAPTADTGTEYGPGAAVSDDVFASFEADLAAAVVSSGGSP